MMRKMSVLALALICAVGLLGGIPHLAAHAGGPHVRIAHLAEGAPAVDVYVGDTLLADGVAYEDVTDYMSVEGYEFALVLVRAGGKLGDALTPEPAAFTFEEGDGGFYTFVIYMVGDALTVVRLPHDGPKAEAAHSEGSGEGEHSGEMVVAEGGAGVITISGTYARAAQKGGVSAAYMVIANSGDKADRLLKVEVGIPAMVELHETKIENEVAKMMPLTAGIEIPAGGTAALKPGGMHIMLMRLGEDLMAGTTLPFTLTFESGTVVSLAVPVNTVN